MEWHTRSARYSLAAGGKVGVILVLTAICYVIIYFVARALGAPSIGEVLDRLLTWLR